MRNFKRFLSLAVAALLLVGAMATGASAAKFTDVPATDAALTDAVELLVSLGVTKGTTETTFGTEENVTRQQMAAFVYRMMKAGKSVEGGSNTTAFTDLTDPTYYFMISWTSNQGIIKGRTDTTFDPKGGITLQDAYTMIVRALGWDDGTYSYPISYIDKAEDLGLDEDLPSTLGYKDTLTRGDLAIILANMFYADTAETEIVYRTNNVVDGNGNVVSSTIVPVEYNLTLAEEVFEVIKVAQKVVATPNKSFGNKSALTDDVAMVELTNAGVVDSDDLDYVDDLGVYTFEDLGLEGNADDYFLSDILMFVKWNDRISKYDIFGATAQGTVKTVTFDKVKFDTVSGTGDAKYYDGADKEYKKINGKLDIDGTTAYLFDAPYSFHKDSAAPEKFNSKFITMVEDTNYDFEEGKLYTKYALVDGINMDDSIVGTYSTEWTYDGYLSQVYFGGLGEIDCYDSNGDGKYEYLFVKNYSLGEIDTAEDAALDYDLASDDDGVETTIYTDLAIVEGEAKDEDIVLAYVNKDANYVKVIEVLTGKAVEVIGTNTVDGDIATVELDDEKTIDLKHIAATIANAKDKVGFDTLEAPAFDTEYTAYYTAAGKLVAFDGAAVGVDLNENWVVVLDNATKESVQMVDGVLVSGTYVTVYNDGAKKALKVAADYSVSDDQYKLATAKANKKGIYTITPYTQPTGSNTDLASDATDAFKFTQVAAATEVTLAKVNGSRYNLKYTAVDATVNLRDYTKAIIVSKEDGEWIVGVYGKDEAPDFKSNIKFKNVSYILTNNVNSSRENLAVFFGVYDGELKPASGEVADIQIVTGVSAYKNEDQETVKKYTVIGADGRTATYTGSNTDYQGTISTGDLVALTTNDLIDEDIEATGNIFQGGGIYDTDAQAFEDYTEIGYVKIGGYDEGILEVVSNSNTYYVTEDTTIIRVDKSSKSAEVLEVADAAEIFDADEYKAADLFEAGYVTAVLVVEEAEENGEYNVLNVIVVKK